MSKSIKIINKLKEQIESAELLEKARERTQDFIRNRKVGFVGLMILIMSLLRKTLQLELDEFINRESHTEVTTYTKQSFSEARQKIKPEVFLFLNDYLIGMYYGDEAYKTYKGYRLLAVDGSKIQLPNNRKTREKYGSIKNNAEKFEMAQALASTLYDVENGIVLHSMLSHCESSERKLAEQHVNELAALNQDIKNLILFDRGYPSFELITHLESTNQKYMMRVKSNFFKEVTGTKTKDEVVTVTVTPSRKKHMKQQGFHVETGDRICMRVIKFPLATGEEEILITNVHADEISHEESKALYFKRWGIETKYDVLKNKFQIENFSGDSVRVIQQDFFATIFLSNIAVLIEEDATRLYEIKDNAKKNMVIA